MVSNPNVNAPDNRRPVSNNNSASKILRNVTDKEGFHFYLAIGEPTEETAVSLADFAKKLEAVAVQSVNFHYPRKDFEKWIHEIIGDAELALRLGRIGRIHMGIKGEALRNEIVRITKMRLTEIKPPPPATSKPPVFGAASGTGRTRELF